MSPEQTKKAIAANIEALRLLIMDALLRATDADKAMGQGEQNQAIGSMYDLEENLENALALYRAAVALHRAGRP
jgi:hypothetical protein